MSASTDDGFRLVQIFLSPKVAVFGVEVNFKDKSLRCDCPRWLRSKTCKHTDFVLGTLTENAWAYDGTLWNTPTQEELDQATESPLAWRRFLINHARVEVL